MHSVLHLRSAIELEQGLPEVLQSPSGVGRLEAIVVRPASNERLTCLSATLTPAGGVDGDRWAIESGDLRSQVSLMNSRFLGQIAGKEDAICLAGDNLIVDFDLSEANLTAGSRLAIGEVILEITDLPHTGCNKLAGRYGDQARAFMNDKQRKALHLRGRYAFVVVGGVAAVGDEVRKLASA
jgi:MOSC domain-containing protein YiiM